MLCIKTEHNLSPLPLLFECVFMITLSITHEIGSLNILCSFQDHKDKLREFHAICNIQWRLFHKMVIIIQLKSNFVLTAGVLLRLSSIP